MRSSVSLSRMFVWSAVTRCSRSTGEGLGGIALVERAADGSGGSSSQLSGLPTVSLDGVTAHELATQLGTVLEWQTAGTNYVLAGSLPAAAAETAARAVK